MGTKVEQASEHYRRALELDRAEKDPIAEYSRGIALQPAEWALQNRGWAYFKRGKLALALADWKNVRGHEQARGRAKLGLGDVDGAIAEFLAALKQEDDEDTRKYLAEAYAAKGVTNPAPRPAKKPQPPRFRPAPRKKNETYDAYVARLLKSAKLSAKTLEAIAAARRPAIVLTPSKSAKGASRIGGQPDLPPGTKWPRSRGKAMSFIGQVQLDDVAKLAKTALPKKGLLAFFVEEEQFEKGTVLHVAGKGVATAPPSDFVRMEDGEKVPRGYKARAVTLTLLEKLPSPSNPVLAKLRWAEGEELAYTALFEAAAESRHQLLGFRDRTYDAEQKATTALLLQCFSDGDMGWGDDDDLYFYISEKALAAGDFAKAFLYCGE